jgi:hypothetical protein
MLRAMAAELVGAWSAKRLSTCLIAATVLVACLAQSAASPLSARASEYADAACKLALFAQLESGHPISAGAPALNEIETYKVNDSCTNTDCWERFTSPETESEECEYGRLANVVVGRYKSKKLASSVVRTFLHKGFAPVKTGADVAGIVFAAEKASILLAVGKVKITYTLTTVVGQGASNPPWLGVKQDAIKGAREIVRILRRRPTCPVDPGACA